MLDPTSSSQYTVNGSTLTIHRIGKSDEGLYYCVYGTETFQYNLCLFVYGELVRRVYLLHAVTKHACRHDIYQEYT